ncbi:quinoprotein glucose dehydrogenase [Azospirillum lipoferum]|uniref:Glucose/quinate/shikimate family membrane-bound PQQ-dependent dehydrogenase n=1 Tax=Azospirillum lipoferum TaxID=193 RepID=A0A5A9GN43_AZOLI|nr:MULTISPECIES: glucose/quinate/shikimate family membrane-bound PQQ-dependent dehydrogenase [Azospirillum]KAA0595803.1 glucose/quinate/shikimate family membrane-bound PQQ-dependent dehydrogenase [Azospirillum lipoferum]MCP1611321.1 quinoprotein glucose dehydrogenase [Azospirillum lipoferum]MDW5537125.1 glucose/quinate/shikimate family membrane-bound PQQ-dependent dehydrogenase [Azospirillum sp. NL1]
MKHSERGVALWAMVILLAILGLGALGGGLWLILLGGSWYYAVAGLLFLATAALLAKRSPTALSVYALLVIGTLVWALWEVGLDWWPLSARGDVVAVVGFLLLLPWITRRLGEREPMAGEPAPGAYPVGVFRGAGIPLTAALAIVLLVAVASWFTDPHRIDGTVPSRQQTASAGTPSGPAIPDGEWQAYGRTGYGQRYSPLTGITPENADRLQVAWSYETGDQRGQPGDPKETTFEVTPLKIGNRLFLCSPHQHVIALDATTGKEVWRRDLQIDPKQLALQHLTCRGLSYRPAPQSAASTPAAGGACAARLYMPTADGRLVALNPEDGSICTGFGENGQVNLWANMPNVRPGAYYSTSPPVVTANLIIVGGTVLDNVSTKEQSGVVRAFDADSGRLVWNWDSARPDQTAPIAEGQTYTVNSPNSWSIASVDEALGMVYLPLGNQPPDQFGGNRSPEVERFSSSVVALDLATGQVRWVFQTVHHDLWDYDVPAQPSLIDLTVDGRTVPALVQPTKQGELFVLDRRTGQPVLPVTEKPAPQGAAEGDHSAPTQPVSALSYDPPPLTGADMWGATMFDQLACRIALKRLRYDGRFTPPSLQGSLIYPGNFGVFNWGSVAVDPQRQIAFTTPTYLAFVSQLVPRQNDRDLYVQGGERPQFSLPALNENFGAPYAVKLAPFVSVLGLPCQAPPWGYVAAADLTTGKIVWKHKNGTTRDAAPVPLPFRMGVPNLGGPVMTAGGVAFLSGTIDYYVRAYDVSTGKQLWESRLPAGGQATPMTYQGEDGRQYVLVVAGGHGSLGTKGGDSVIAYALAK